MLKNATKFFTIAVIAVIVFLPSYTQMQDLKHKNEQYERQIKELTRANLKLKEERRLLADDPAYFEKVARERMGLVKENEVIYKFVPAVEAQTNAQHNLPTQ